MTEISLESLSPIEPHTSDNIKKLGNKDHKFLHNFIIKGFGNVSLYELPQKPESSFYSTNSPLNISLSV
jgi:hypothetical protein